MAIDTQSAAFILGKLTPGSASYSPQSATRDLQLQSGEPAAILSNSSNLSQNVGSSVPDFNNIINLLKQYQQFGQQQGTQAQVQQAQSVFNTPQNLIGANPALQAGVRNDIAQTFNPTIGSARDLVSQAKQAINDYQESQVQQQAQLRNSLSLAAEAGSMALEGLYKSNPQAFKAAGLDAPSFIAGIKAKETEATRRFNALHGDGDNVPSALFTKNQLNKGASIAGISLQDFKALDYDTQNFFINRAGDIKAKEKVIDTAKTNGDDPRLLEKEISESDAPEAVKNVLVKHLKTRFKDEYARFAQPKKNILKRIFHL